MIQPTDRGVVISFSRYRLLCFVCLIRTRYRNLATQISLFLYVVLHNEIVNVESQKKISTPIDGNQDAASHWLGKGSQIQIGAAINVEIATRAL